MGRLLYIQPSQGPGFSSFLNYFRRHRDSSPA
jgi:hypothetical protein